METYTLVTWPDSQELMEESWKDILGHKGSYMVSTLGQVKSLDRVISNGNAVKGVILKPYISRGYDIVRLFTEKTRVGHSIHRLMALAFIPNPDNLPEVNHIDGIKSHNVLTNLEWCTSSYNAIHAVKNRLIPSGKDNAYSKAVEQYSMSGGLIASFHSMTEANRITGVNIGSISQCTKNKIKQSGGYIWKLKTK